MRDTLIDREGGLSASIADLCVNAPGVVEQQLGRANVQEHWGKSTQVGVSAWAVRWALYHSDTKGLTGLYVFPTARDMWDFSTLRVGPIIRNSPRLSRRQKPDDPDNKGMKGIGLGTVVFRGSESPRGLESVDADHMVFDEYELLEPTHIPNAERRTGASLYGYKRRIGWPFIPNAGIDKLYTESDQRRWNVKCGSCNEWQDISFNDATQSRPSRTMLMNWASGKSRSRMSTLFRYAGRLSPQRGLGSACSRTQASMIDPIVGPAPTIRRSACLRLIPCSRRSRHVW